MHVGRKLLNLITMMRFPGSSKYWELRYRLGGNSGEGSYGPEARYKSEFLNHCFSKFGVASAIDFGCGDGNQVATLELQQYLGLDVSDAAVTACRARYAKDASKEFLSLREYAGQKADAALSLDVIYHLVEDDVYYAYMQRLFAAARKIVVVYTANHEDNRQLRGKHVRRRDILPWVEQQIPEFVLVDSPERPGELPSPDGASFFVFQHGNSSA